jgi:hypothetical protein
MIPEVFARIARFTCGRGWHLWRRHDDDAWTIYPIFRCWICRLETRFPKEVSKIRLYGPRIAKVNISRHSSDG